MTTNSNHYGIYMTDDVTRDLANIAAGINTPAMRFHEKNLLFPPNVLGEDDEIETGRIVRRCVHLFAEMRPSFATPLLDRWLARYNVMQQSQPPIEYLRLTGTSGELALENAQWLIEQGNYVKPISRRGVPNVRPALMFAIFHAAEYAERTGGG